MKNKILSILLIMMMFIGIAVPSYASEKKNNDQDVLNKFAYYLRDSSEKKVHSDGINTIYTFTIYDKKELSKYENKSEGELVSRTITYVIPNDISSTTNNKEIYQPRWFDTYDIKNWRYEGNQFYTPSRGTPHTIEGEAHFTLSTSATEYYELSGSAGFKVESIVEAKIGGKIGDSVTKNWELQVDVPQGYTRKLEVWQYLNKYSFDVTKNGSNYGSSAVFIPNGGQRITNDLYRTR